MQAHAHTERAPPPGTPPTTHGGRLLLIMMLLLLLLQSVSCVLFHIANFWTKYLIFGVHKCADAEKHARDAAPSKREQKTPQNYKKSCSRSCKMALACSLMLVPACPLIQAWLWRHILASRERRLQFCLEKAVDEEATLPRLASHRTACSLFM